MLYPASQLLNGEYCVSQKFVVTALVQLGSVCHRQGLDRGCTVVNEAVKKVDNFIDEATPQFPNLVSFNEELEHIDLVETEHEIVLTCDSRRIQNPAIALVRRCTFANAAKKQILASGTIP